MATPKAAPTPGAGPTAQELVDRFLPRMLNAGILTARRVDENITSALGVLGAHVGRAKTEPWRNQTSWIITKLKDDTMDGLTILLSVNQINALAHQQDRTTVFSLANKAKQALFSSPIAMHGAAALEKGSLIHFTKKCEAVQKDVQTLIQTHVDQESEAQNQGNQVSPFRERQKHGNDPSRKGLSGL